jgi:hypothetical protein
LFKQDFFLAELSFKKTYVINTGKDVDIEFRNDEKQPISTFDVATFFYLILLQFNHWLTLPPMLFLSFRKSSVTVSQKLSNSGMTRSFRITFVIRGAFPDMTVLNCGKSYEQKKVAI